MSEEAKKKLSIILSKRATSKQRAILKRCSGTYLYYKAKWSK